MSIQHNVSLKAFNTFSVAVNAENYYYIDQLDQLSGLSKLPKPHFYLGAGSNVLFTKDYSGTIIHNCMKGIEVLEESESSILVRVCAGESWHDFVRYSLDQQWFGLEYLAYIPGNIGASPVQNIGAYGVEVCQYIENVHVYNVEAGRLEVYTNDECTFGYRDSAFKKHLTNHLVTHVDFRLLKTQPKQPKLYPALQEYFMSHNIVSPNSEDIYQAVVSVRQSKLPEVGDIGSAGSFFKNPVVSKEYFSYLIEKFPNLLSYPYDDQHVKIPAGQLIDLLGFKGQYKNNVGMYEKQALVLVNLGGASGQDLYDYSLTIMNAVNKHFGVILEPEVIIL